MYYDQNAPERIKHLKLEQADIEQNKGTNKQGMYKMYMYANALWNQSPMWHESPLNPFV